MFFRNRTIDEQIKLLFTRASSTLSTPDQSGNPAPHRLFPAAITPIRAIGI
jgi:hypothetical protein